MMIKNLLKSVLSTLTGLLIAVGAILFLLMLATSFFLRGEVIIHNQSNSVVNNIHIEYKNGDKINTHPTDIIVNPQSSEKIKLPPTSDTSLTLHYQHNGEQKSQPFGYYGSTGESFHLHVKDQSQTK